jgi:Family of unknown function (DUF6263)
MKVRRAHRRVIPAISLALVAFFWSQAAHAQVKLQYKFPESKTLKYKTNAKITHILSLAGQEFETRNDETMVRSRAVGTKRADGGLPVEEKIESVRIELAIPGGTNVTYDTSDPNAKIDNPDLAFLSEAFKLVAETAFTVVLDGGNKVKAVEGSEKLLEKADKLSPQARDVIRSHLETDKLKMNFEQELGNVPDIVTRPGESWERNEISDIGSGQTLHFQKKYEYVGTEKKGDKTFDKIRGTATKVELKQDPAVNAQFKVLKGDMKVESSEETILFDRELGRVQSSHSKVRVKGDKLTLSINGMELEGGLDLTIETTNELQPAAK